MSGKQSDEQADQANKSRGCVDHSSRSARRVEVAWNGSKAVLKPVRSMDAATQATVTRAMEMQAMGTRATARRAPYTLEVGKAVGLSRVGRQASCETPVEWRRGTAADSTTASALTAKRVAKRRSDNLQRERL